MSLKLPYASEAVRLLRTNDPGLRPVLEKIGECTVRRITNRFQALAWSILSQQISIKAAASIRRKLLETLKPRSLEPEAILELPDDTMRAAGVSTAKARYLRDLAEKVHQGHVNLRGIHHRDDEAVIEELVQIKGIGRWTAEMFLIFSLGRPDVLPVDDLGLRIAVQRLDGLSEAAPRDYVRERGELWKPYRSIATWYLWQSLK